MNSDMKSQAPQGGRRADGGFTLVEILIAIVLVGILSAVVVVGISSLTSKGNSSACAASLDAAKAGTVVYYASNSNVYPPTIKVMVTTGALTLPSGVTIDATGLIASQGTNWKLTMTPGTLVAPLPTFLCS